MSLANSIAATVPKTKHFGKNERKKVRLFFFSFFFETFSMVQKICRKNSNDATVLKSQLFLSGRLKKFREINALFLKIDNSVN